MRVLFFIALLLEVVSTSNCPSLFEWADGIGCVNVFEWDVLIGLDDMLRYNRGGCAKYGAHLPMIKSVQEDEAFGRYFRSLPLDMNMKTFDLLELDLVCNATTRRLEWIDGSAVDYTPHNITDEYGNSADLYFDCVSTGKTAVSAPFLSRWEVVDSDYYYYYIGMCVIDASELATGTPTTTSKPTYPPTTVSTLRPTTTIPTYSTIKQSTGTSPPPTTPAPSIPVADYCTCQTSTIYLDIVFVVDTSNDMTAGAVKDITATIQSTLYGLTFGTGRYQSNIAALAYAEVVQTVRNFGNFKSTKDISSFSLPFLGGKSQDMALAIAEASSMIKTSGRVFSRGVIVLFSNTFDQSKSSNIENVTKVFKDDGGIFISLDYSRGTGLVGLEDLASPGYFINDTSLSNPDLDADLLYAFCDANCFCKDDLIAYDSTPNARGRNVANDGCYRVADFSAVYEAAKDRCEVDHGFVATVHDSGKAFFLLSLFPAKARYWLGLQRIGGSYQWADGLYDPYTYWASGNPIGGQDCVYSQQQNGFNTAWYSAPCADPLKNSMTYACQISPCTSEFDCWA